MWWKVNFNKLVTFLIPMCLRDSFLVQLLKCLIAPIAYLHDLWLDFYNTEWTRVNVVPRVDVLERYIKKETGNASVTITSPDVQRTPPLYFLNEGGTPTIINKQSEGKTPYYIGDEYYVPSGATIIINALRLTQSQKKKIENIMSIFKPCGRNYRINILNSGTESTENPIS